MTDLSAVAGLTPHERRTLAEILTTVANGGAASVTNGPRASARNGAFVDLLRDLTEAGLLSVKSEGSEHGTGTLVAAEEVEGELQSIASAARGGSDDLTVSIGSATSAEAVGARQEAAAERAALIEAVQANRLPDGIPPPPGYDRDMKVVDPALAYPGFAAGAIPPVRDPAPTAVTLSASAHLWAQATRAFAQSMGPRYLTLAHDLRTGEREDRAA